jgi:hypothetical protein
MATNPFIIEGPPRLSGTPETDVRVLLQWVNAVHRVLSREINIGQHVVDTNESLAATKQTLGALTGIRAFQTPIAPGTVAAGAAATGLVSADGVIPSNLVVGDISTLTNAAWGLTCRVVDAGFVRWTLHNLTGGSVNVPPGLLRCIVFATS